MQFITRKNQQKGAGYKWSLIISAGCVVKILDGIFHNFTVNCSHSDAACQRNVAVPGYYILLGISAPWRIFLTVFFGLHKIQSECISVHFSGQLRHEIDHKLSWFVLEMLKVGSFCVSVTLVDMNAFNSTFDIRDM